MNRHWISSDQNFCSSQKWKMSFSWDVRRWPLFFERPRCGSRHWRGDRSWPEWLRPRHKRRNGRSKKSDGVNDFVMKVLRYKMLDCFWHHSSDIRVTFEWNDNNTSTIFSFTNLSRLLLWLSLMKCLSTFSLKTTII